MAGHIVFDCFRLDTGSRTGSKSVTAAYAVVYSRLKQKISHSKPTSLRIVSPPAHLRSTSSALALRLISVSYIEDLSEAERLFSSGIFIQLQDLKTTFTEIYALKAEPQILICCSLHALALLQVLLYRSGFDCGGQAEA